MQFLGISHGALSYEDTDNQEGMSLRDYFAGKVIGTLARYATDHDAAADKAYSMADAMLKRRALTN